jgi:Ca2+/Na+ antiporter
LVTIYTFLALAIICDEYFCESLEAISEALSLSEDVAGATFMAAGSSAPELFTAIVTTLITGGSAGLGTIVGSAVFNIMIIVGVTALCAGQQLKIYWYPLMRDSMVYVISIVMMVCVMADFKVTAVESGILVAAYFGYIAIMVYNKQINEWAERKFGSGGGGGSGGGAAGTGAISQIAQIKALQQGHVNNPIQNNNNQVAGRPNPTWTDNGMSNGGSINAMNRINAGGSVTGQAAPISPNTQEVCEMCCLHRQVLLCSRSLSLTFTPYQNIPSAPTHPHTPHPPPQPTNSPYARSPSTSSLLPILR